MFVFEAFLPNEFLAETTFLPLRFRTFVTSDMNIRTREKIHDLRQHILNETKGFFSWEQYILRNAPPGPYFIDLIRISAKLRIGRKHGLGMPRHFNLGHDSDIPLCGIGHDVLHLDLRVKTTIGFAVCFVVPIMTNHGLLTHRGFLCEQRIFLYLNPPTLIFGKVPMENIELV